MLYWTSGVTRFDHIRTKDIRDRMGLHRLWKELREGRSRWYGYIIPANENAFAKIGLNTEFNGKRLESWQKQRWLDTLGGDLKASRLHPGQAFEKKWRNR